MLHNFEIQWGGNFKLSIHLFNVLIYAFPFVFFIFKSQWLLIFHFKGTTTLPWWSGLRVSVTHRAMSAGVFDSW